MQTTVPEEARDIPVLEEVDVLVAGGGVAGCAAAVAAARAGASTLLMERNGCLGGVATATLMANIGNRFLTASGEQVISGFAGEVVERLVAVGAASPRWRHRDVPGVVIDSERLKVVLIEMAEEAGVRVLTHAVAARPVMHGSAVRGVFCESKSGRQAVLAKATVDATGEADLAYQAGARCHFQTGTASILFKLANVDLDAFVAFLRQDPEGFPAGQDYVRDLETFERNWRERGTLFFPHGGGRTWPFLQQAVARGDLKREIPPAFSLDAFGLYAIGGPGFVVVNSNFYRIADLDVRNLSEFELHAQKICFYVADFVIKHVPGFSRARVAHVGVDLGIRVSRYIEGRTVLDGNVISAPAPVLADDVIGTFPVSDQRPERQGFFRDYTCDIPFGITVPMGCDNLLVASGKSVSTAPPAILRGMTGCMICGQGVGAASALAAAKGLRSADVPVRELQRELLSQKACLGEQERLRALGLA
jgi:hypothetical protein